MEVAICFSIFVKSCSQSYRVAKGHPEELGLQCRMVNVVYTPYDPANTGDQEYDTKKGDNKPVNCLRR